MALEFDRSVQSTTFYSPLEDFDEVTVDVEVRTDPLTDRTARIVPDNFLMPDAEPDIDPVVGDSEGCFFCPGSVGEVTPTYPDWVGFDRGRVGEATSFPNLNPYGAHSNVVALTEDHYRPIDEFTTDVFRDGLQAALEFVNRALDHDESAEFASVNMNFLRPAGSSIIHPHMQTLVDDRGTNEQALLTRAAREYYDEQGSVYWQDLVDEVTSTDRYLGSTGGADWLAPFAPKHHRHVVGVCEESGVPGPQDGAVADLAEGIVNVLEYYGSVGLNSFNFALYLSAEAAMQPVVDVVGRSVFDQYYWSDSSFFSVLHGEGVVDVAPESYAEEAQEFF